MKIGTRMKLFGIVLGAACAMGTVFLASGCGEHTHNYARYEIETEATCTKDGVARNYCECGAYEESKIQALGHQYQVSETESKEASCFENGITVEICSNCGDRKETQTDLLPHDYGMWTVIKQATTEEEGLQIRKCKRKGCTASEEEKIPVQMEFTVQVLRATGDIFPNTQNIRILIKDEEGEVVKSATNVSVKFTLPQKNYRVFLDNVPQGYIMEQESYPVTNETETVNIMLSASLRTEKPDAAVSYRTGSVMHDYEMEIVELKEENDYKISISDLLKEYKAIYINLYFTTCKGCVPEMDHIVEAYQATSSTGRIYGDEIAMVMLARSGLETKDRIRNFKADPNFYCGNVYNVSSRNLPTYMAYCDELEAAFERDKAYFSSWPTSILIDSEGVVVYMKSQSADSASFFTSIMEHGIDNYYHLHKDETKPAPGTDGAVVSVPLADCLTACTPEEPDRDLWIDLARWKKFYMKKDENL